LRGLSPLARNILEVFMLKEMTLLEKRDLLQKLLLKATDDKELVDVWTHTKIEPLNFEDLELTESSKSIKYSGELNSTQTFRIYYSKEPNHKKISYDVDIDAFNPSNVLIIAEDIIKILRSTYNN
jgi:hypothetical protein